jgi:hypothetical protein
MERNFQPSRGLGWHHLLMDERDPEERHAELEHHQVEPVGQPPQFHDTQTVAGWQPVAYPGQGTPQDFGAPAGVVPQPAFPGEPGVGRRAGPLRRLWLLGIWLAAIGVAALSLLFFGLAAYDFYAYQTGKPTTATIEHCTSFSHTHRQRSPVTPLVGSVIPRGESCTATWSVAGQSQIGPIEGLLYRDHDATSVDVRVHGDKAYTSLSGVPSLMTGALILVLGVLVAFVIWTGRRLRRIIVGVIDFFSD